LLGFAEDTNYEMRSRLRQQCAKFLRFAYYVDFTVQDALKAIFLQSASDFAAHLNELLYDNDFKTKLPLFKSEVTVLLSEVPAELIVTQPLAEFIPKPEGESDPEDFRALFHVQLRV